jgi:hypothetical protein
MQNKYQTDTQILSQIKHVIEKHNQSIRKICMELYYNDDAIALMNSEPSSISAAEIKNKLHKINATTLTLHPFIHSIYFYNGNARQYYSTHTKTDYVVKDVFLAKMLNRQSSVPLLQPTLRKINVLNGTGYATEYVFTYVMCNMITGFNKNDPALIVNIRLDSFLDEIRSVAMSNQQQGDFFALITEDGVWFPDQAYTDENSFVENLTNMFLSKIMVIFHQGSKLGIVTERIDDAEYLISFTKVGGTNLTIVKSQPYDIVFSHMTDTFYHIVIITITAIFIAIMASVLLSWRIYRPIGKLMKIVDENLERPRGLSDKNEMDFLSNAYVHTIRELHDIQEKRFADADIHRKNFWIQLFKGTLDAADVRRASSDHLISVDLFSPFYFWVVKIDNYTKIRELGSRDYNLYKYAIANIFSEIISNRFACELFELENDRFGVLVAPARDCGARVYDSFQELSREGQHAVLRHLDIYVSVSFSRLISDFSGVAAEYSCVSQNMQYRIIYGKMCVIRPDMVEENNKMRSYEYPFALEEALLHEIKQGNLAEAEARLDLVMIEIEKMDYSSIVISVLRLYNTVCDVLARMYENNFVPPSESLGDISVNYLEQHTTAEVRTTIWQEMQNAVKAIKDTSINGRRNILVNTVSSLILSNY